MGEENIIKTIEHKLRKALKPEVLNIQDISHQHRHHKLNPHQSEDVVSHLSVLIISEQFAGMKVFARHKLIYDLLNEELSTLHALQLKTLTIEEHRNEGAKAKNAATQTK